MTERPGGAGVFPNQSREPDGWEVEHDLDPADLADALVEITGKSLDAVRGDLARMELDDDWTMPDHVRERRRYSR